MEFIIIRHWWRHAHRSNFALSKKKMMGVRKSIAIVGATEKLGEEIAFQFMDNNYSLLLISNNKEKLDYLEKKVNAKNPKAEINFVQCVKDGCWEADIIILTVPCDEKRSVAELMHEVATQKIIVLFSNEETDAQELTKFLPYSKVVRVSGDVTSKSIVINGNDEAVNEEISGIFNEAGYRVSKYFPANK
ncbi:MAG: NAD(P)-binding domain-containing protein [Ginsengibacter sp.]